MTLKVKVSDMPLFHVTIFPDEKAYRVTRQDMSLPKLRQMIHDTTAASKGELMWLKLARFGEKRSKKNCLRNDKNVLKISGIELDYDSEVMSFEEAIKIATAANIRSLIYTTASYTEDEPRWRILCPTSCEREPGERTKYVDRVDGLFGGIFSGESWTLSQGMLFGSVNNNPTHRAEIVDGDFIDLRDDLDAGAIGKQQEKTKANGKDHHSAKGFEAHLARLGDGEGLDGFHKPLRDAVASYVATHGAGFDRDALKARLRQEIERAPQDKPRDYLNGDKHIDELIDSAIEKGFGDTPQLKALGFIIGDKHVPVSSQGNIRLAMEQLGVKVRHDAFQDRSIIEGLEKFDLLDDRAMDRLWLVIDEKFKFRPAKDFFWTVVADEARRNSFHPVCEYLDGLKWDGQERIDKWPITYAKAKDTAYVRAVGALMLVAAVRRARRPGCKFDEMPVFQSKQGLDKSSAFSILAVRPEWFSDDLPLSADSKRMIEHLKGRWIVEAAELKGMRHSDIEHLKSFLSRTVDRARMSYDRATSELLRQCIIVGTTNHEKFLRDLTGNRRYWPLQVGAFDLVKLKQDRDQLWAEAAAREARGESIRLDSKLWSQAAVEQEERTIAEPWIEVIQGLLGNMKGKLLSADAWKLVGMVEAQRTQGHNERLGVAMRACGWKREKLRFGDLGPQWCYVRGSSACDQQIKVEFDWRTRETSVRAVVQDAGDVPF